MKKVLIVSYSFPPVNTVAAKRYGTMCKYFEENGYKPYVITTDRIFTEGVYIKKELDIPISREQVITIGRSSFNSANKTFLSFMMLQILNSNKYISRVIDAESIGWFEKVKQAVDLDHIKDVDIIIGTFPLVGNLYVARYLSKKLKCPYIVDVRDLISDYAEREDGYKANTVFEKLVESILLINASGIVTVTPGARDILKKRYFWKKNCVVYNGWDYERQICTGNNEEQYLYYAGLFYPHRLESLKKIIRCLKIVNQCNDKKIKFLIRSIGPKKMDDKVNMIIQQETMQDSVIMLDATSEDIVAKERANAYINVVLSKPSDDDESIMAMIPAKLYELLREEPPILAVAPGDSDIAKVLNYTQKGIASVDDNEIISFILENNKKYKGNIDRISFFSRRKQAERMCRFMDSVLNE